jgi:hypothetical protein
MRKPRDYDAELKLLNDKAKALKARKLEQLGELVVATGADTLPLEQLAGALLMATEQKDAVAAEAQRARGAAFFQAAQRSRRGSGSSAGSGPASDGAASPAASSTGAP